jgi:hypothetical protein
MHMTMHNCVGIRVGMLTTSPTLGESGTTGCCLDTTTNRNNDIQSVPQHIVKANQTHTSMHNDHCRWIMSHTSECSGFGSAGKLLFPGSPLVHSGPRWSLLVPVDSEISQQLAWSTLVHQVDKLTRLTPYVSGRRQTHFLPHLAL